MARPDSDTALLMQIRTLIETERELYERNASDEGVRLWKEVLGGQLERSWELLRERRRMMSLNDQLPSLFGRVH